VLLPIDWWVSSVPMNRFVIIMPLIGPIPTIKAVPQGDRWVWSEMVKCLLDPEDL
jgi:hypothetical protein